MKKQILVLWMSVILFFVLAGCSKVVHGIDLPFELTDIESIEVYRYTGVPQSAEMKMVTDQKDMEALYLLFCDLTLQEKQVEEVAGATVVLFQFHLLDSTHYEITYIGNGVKNGILKSSTGHFEYFTIADIAGRWNHLEYEALPVEIDSLPINHS